MPTQNYQAGVESNAVQLSYGKEANWGELSAVAFQALRMQSEGFQEQKQRSRPNEIRNDAQASPGVTQSIAAPGSLNFALSIGTYDDVLESMMLGGWRSTVAINAVGGDIAFAATGNKITSTTANKFTNVPVGMWLDVRGCTLNPARMFLYVVSKTSNTDITVLGKTLVDETPAGTAVKIRNGGMLRNDAEFYSLYVQKMLGPNLFLRYPGAYTTQGTLNGQQGQFMSGSFNFAAIEELEATTNASTGAILPAPTGRIVDTVAGMTNLMLDGTPIAATVQALNLNIQKEGAGADYGIGSPKAQGMKMGTFTATGTASIFFKNFDLYQIYKQEREIPISYATVDNAGAGYMFSLPKVILGTSKITAGGPNQSVIAEFNIEANKDESLGTTMQIDRFAAAA